MAVWLSLSLSQGTPNETARTTTVTATLTIHYNGGSYNGYSPPGQIVIDGQTFDFTQNYNYAGIGQGAVTTGTGSTSVSRTATVEYGSSSTRTVSVTAWFESGSSVSGTVYASDSIALTSISSGGSSGGGDDGDDDDEGGGSGSGGSDSEDDGIDPLPGNVSILGQTMLTKASENMTYYLNAGYDIKNHDAASWEQIVIIKFVTPAFDGISQSLDINLYDIKSANSSYDVTMCCALCTSDENNGMYFSAPSVVDDPSQITSVLLLDNEGLKPFSLYTDQLESQTEYYLVLWQPTDYRSEMYAEIGAANNHGFTVNYIAYDNGCHIDNGSEYVGYECFIDNGTTWDKYRAYIDNGTSWVPYT